jgi:hypothetical protein
MNCRHCKAQLTVPFMDLGNAPPSNAYLTEEMLKKPEKWFPLRVFVCTECWLVQTEDYAEADELFTDDYAYFSSFSKSWLDHTKHYVETVTERFGLGSQSYVVEVAANDGYLLQYMKQRNIPCLGIEPTKNTAQAAREKGIEVVTEFFGIGLAGRLAAQGVKADLMIANNVLAHVPDINDFVAGFSILLGENGVATFEFPHLLNLVSHNQFDTIYHEHYSYLSLTSVLRVFESNGLSIFDVEELPTHGGSLRVYAQRYDGLRQRAVSIDELLLREQTIGLTSADFYCSFQAKAEKAKNDFVMFLLKAKNDAQKVMAYGAAAKGNTLLNFAGVRPDVLSCVVDDIPAKQGKYLPGSHIPIVAEDRIRKERPNYIVILPWNFSREIVEKLAYVRDWGGRFVTAVPQLQIQ